MKQLTFFEMERPVYRLRNGRYATKEMAYADKQNSENQRLKLEVEKYKRMYLAVVKENKRLTEQLNGRI
jgi:cell shape-determining protein MreC